MLYTGREQAARALLNNDLQEGDLETIGAILREVLELGIIDDPRQKMWDVVHEKLEQDLEKFFCGAVSKSNFDDVSLDMIGFTFDRVVLEVYTHAGLTEPDEHFKSWRERLGRLKEVLELQAAKKAKREAAREVEATIATLEPAIQGLVRQAFKKSGVLPQAHTSTMVGAP